ncbi:AIPR family protein [Spiroplasma clarkii]|uniref:AIPR family protein n=1 Tax=Spiroplasma clarkii TaxID=2139 RepID=UPI002FDF9BC2
MNSLLSKFQDRIFERNVRYNIDSGSISKSVDKNIEETVASNPEKFFIFNNGITVVTEKIYDLDIQNNTVLLNNFSIVNGAQTVTNLNKLFGKSKLKDNLSKVFVVAKIIETKSDKDGELIEKITKSSNNQKPVQPRDFRSNAAEMIELKKFFKENQIILNIKRGDSDINEKNYIIKNFNLKEENIKRLWNDRLGQYIYSLILMKPTVALQNKNKIFNDEHYNLVFKNESISNEDKLLAYKFYDVIEKMVQLANNDIEPSRIEEVKPLMLLIQNWIIALLWLIWNNLDNLNELISIKEIDQFKNSKGTFINKNSGDEITVNQELLARYLYECYENLWELYKKKKIIKMKFMDIQHFHIKRIFWRVCQVMLTSNYNIRKRSKKKDTWEHI